MKTTHFLLILVFLYVKQEASTVSGYEEVYEAKDNVEMLYKTLNSKLLTLKMRLNQTEEKVQRTSQELIILKKVRNLLQEITNHRPCKHEYLLLNFRYKQSINIEAISEIPEHYTIRLEVTHKALVDENQAQRDGHDLRVFYLPSKGSFPVEIDRIVQNLNTNSTVVEFRVQRRIPAGTVDCKSYALVFGGKYSGKPKDDERKVFALFEDFQTSRLKDWKKVWGEWTITNGQLFGKTGISNQGSGEVGIYFVLGNDWKDIEVELDLMETDLNIAFPGPFLRISDPSLKTTTAWWFEYYSNHKGCTMRPFKDNKDGGWKYQCTLPGKLEKNKWYQFKYRLKGNKIKQWANGKLIQNVTVGNEWMISKGTIGLGCHEIYKGSPTGCRTYYDNIKVRMLAKTSPVVSLGRICNIGHSERDFVLGGKENPAYSCKDIYKSASLTMSKTPVSGIYWIKIENQGIEDRHQIFCDMRMGGWTLVGKIRGQAGNIYNSWLVKNINVEVLKSSKPPTGNAKYGCLDSRGISVKHSSEIMLSSGENADGVGAKWIRWQLPSEREQSTWWNHGLGYNAVLSVPSRAVTVIAWNGNEGTCYQNKYGIMPLKQHGGSYPYASYNKNGNTRANDYCMAVGVLLKGSSADGWSQNGNGYDSPQKDSDWPNGLYNHQQPHVLVWLK